MHYNWRHPDRAKRGKPILSGGQPLPRPARDEGPDCAHCMKTDAWTTQSRQRFQEWRLWLMGIGPEPTEDQALDFLVLDDAWDAAESVRLQNAVALAFGADGDDNGGT